MKKAIVLAMLLSIVSVFASAQQTPMAHVHPKIKVTDGAVNPELIPDLVAYRLYLLNISTKVNPTLEETRFQSAHFRDLGLPPVDELRMVGILREFRDRYDSLVTRFNIQATAAQARGELVDQTLFLQQLDDAVGSARASIRTLTGVASSNIENKVQSEKKRMKHFESEAQ